MTTPNPAQKIKGLKLCWVVVSFVRLGRIQNFRPLEALFLVEVESRLNDIDTQPKEKDEKKL